MELFSEENYRKIVKMVLKARPNNGRGQASRLAMHLRINTTLVSQVLSGKRDFTEEQAMATANFLGLSRHESYYFLLLVQLERAGTEELKSIFKDQILKIRREAKSLKGRVTAAKELSAEEQAVYYSNWLYAAIHTLVSINEYQSSYSIAKKLSIDETQIRQMIEQLINYGLIKEQGGNLKSGALSTYIPPDSPLVWLHHKNWRQLAMQKMTVTAPQDFHFTAPFSIAKTDYEWVRQELVEFLSRLYKKVGSTNPEELACLNIDLLKV